MNILVFYFDTLTAESNDVIIYDDSGCFSSTIFLCPLCQYLKITFHSYMQNFAKKKTRLTLKHKIFSKAMHCVCFRLFFNLWWSYVSQLAQCASQKKPIISDSSFSWFESLSVIFIPLLFFLLSISFTGRSFSVDPLLSLSYKSFGICALCDPVTLAFDLLSLKLETDQRTTYDEVFVSVSIVLGLQLLNIST